MGIRLLVGACVVALLSAATAATAQEAVSQGALGTGWFDVGYRALSVDGDPARFQKYRDYSDGATLDIFRWQVDKNSWLVNAEADHVGYRDQRYFAEAQRPGKVKMSFEWLQVPVFLSTDTESLYTYSGDGVFLMDDAIQRGVETGQFTLASQVGRAVGFDTRWQNDFLKFDLTATPVRDLDLKFWTTSRRRSGQTIFAGNFGFTNAVELAAPLKDRSTDMNVAAEWANQRGQAGVGYTHSWYDNSLATLVYDNPIRITDSPTAGSSRGRHAYWPSNSMDNVLTSGAVNLPARSRASASISIGSWKQDDVLVPATINPALPVVPLERSSAEAEAHVVGMNYNVNSRPMRHLWLNGRYRYYDYDNRTPEFAITNMVVGDASLGAAEESLRMAFTRHTVDLDASFTPWSFTAFKAGYTHEQYARVDRIYEETGENTVRASIDSTGNPYFTLRAVFEHGERVGSGFEPGLLAEVGEHLEMRHYDVADRRRNRATFIATATPTPALGLNGSVAVGNDDYENSGFGLRDNDHRVYSAGFDIVPNDRVSVDATYGFEHYTSLQTSRTAFPLSATDVSFLDPRRNWDDDATDKVHNVTAGVDLTRLFTRTDLRFSYNYSWSKATYLYTTAPGWTESLPRLATPVPLDPLQNRLITFRGHLLYSVNRKLGIGGDYHYELYDVDDFAFEPDATGSIYPPTSTGTPANAMYLNYVWRPYRAHVVTVKLRYLW